MPNLRALYEDSTTLINRRAALKCIIILILTSVLTFWGYCIYGVTGTNVRPCREGPPEGLVVTNFILKHYILIGPPSY